MSVRADAPRGCATPAATPAYWRQYFDRVAAAALPSVGDALVGAPRVPWLPMRGDYTERQHALNIQMQFWSSDQNNGESDQHYINRQRRRFTAMQLRNANEFQRANESGEELYDPDRFDRGRFDPGRPGGAWRGG